MKQFPERMRRSRHRNKDKQVNACPVRVANWDQYLLDSRDPTVWVDPTPLLVHVSELENVEWHNELQAMVVSERSAKCWK